MMCIRSIILIFTSCKNAQNRRNLSTLQLYHCKSSVILLTDIFHSKNYSQVGNQKVPLVASHYLINNKKSSAIIPNNDTVRIAK